MTRQIFSEYSARLHQFSRLEAGRTDLQERSKDEQDRHFNDLAVELFALQIAHNPPYRGFCEARGFAPGKMSQWAEIPAIPAAAFKEFAVTSLAPDERTVVFHSSGTTEQSPSRHFHNDESLAIYEASALPWFEAHLIDGGNLPVVSLTPPRALARHSSLVYMFDAVSRAFGAEGSAFTGSIDQSGAWQLDLERTCTALDRAEKAGRAVLVLGTAFSFVQLLDYLASCGKRLRLPGGSRALETGGYKGRSRVLAKAELYSLIAEYLAIAGDSIISEYGMSELSSQAYDSKIPSLRLRSNTSTARREFHFPPWARARIVSPETGREVAEGETGLIRVYDLANVRSVMAIQTEDLGIRRGDGFELLGRAALSEPRGCSLMVA